MPITTKAHIILASTSAIRRALLDAAGVRFDVAQPDFDETAYKPRIAHLSPLQQALTLAQEKALSVSKQQKAAYVIGADQICWLDGRALSKPETAARAIAQLAVMRNKTHTLNCGCVIARGDAIIWQHSESARLTMRNINEAEIAAYVTLDNPLNACGSYKFESYGKHLFTHVVGNFDSIQGLPMVTLLAQLYKLQLLALN